MAEMIGLLTEQGAEKARGFVGKKNLKHIQPGMIVVFEPAVPSCTGKVFRLTKKKLKRRLIGQNFFTLKLNGNNVDIITLSMNQKSLAEVVEQFEERRRVENGDQSTS